MKLYYIMVIKNIMTTATQKDKNPQGLFFFLVQIQHLCIKLMGFSKLTVEDLHPYILGKVKIEKGNMVITGSSPFKHGPTVSKLVTSSDLKLSTNSTASFVLVLLCK